MLVLLCLLFNTFTYTAENVPLISVVVQDGFSIVENIKKQYQLCKPYWEPEKIHFYNPIKDTVESFKPKADILNLFAEIENLPFSTILKEPAMLSFLNNNQIKLNALDTLDTLFQEIEDFSSYQPYLQKKILYHFQRFLYVITSKTDCSVQITSYTDFLMSTEQDLSIVYNRKDSFFKRIMIFGWAGLTAAFGSVGLGLAFTDHNNLSLALPLCSMPPVGWVLATTPYFLLNHFYYKKAKKTIETLQQDIQK